MSSDLGQRAKDAVLRCRAGDYRGASGLLTELGAAGGPGVRAWNVALRTLVWLAFPAHATLPSLDELRALASLGHEAHEGAALACEAWTMTRVLAWDLPGLDATIAIHGSLPSLPASKDLVARGLGCAWSSLLRGTPDTAAFDALVAEASALKDPALLVHAASLRALGFASSGDVEGALGFARRASMMARSEGLPQEEYLAHLVLARVRRLGRQTHRALRILQAMESVASPPWHGWMTWEKAFAAGDVPDAAHAHGRPIDDALEALRSTLKGAAESDPARFAHGIEGLASATSGASFAARESHDLVQALTSTSRALMNDDLSAWASGRSPLLPAQLHGFRLRSHQDASAESASAYVLVQTAHARGVSGDVTAPRRILSWAKDLLAPPDAAALPQSRRVEGRVETLIAVLALSGDDGCPEEECFTQTYGFDFVADRHRSVFDVLIHRARAFVEGHAVVRREQGRLRLEPLRSFVVPDPRCAERVTDRLLRVLAQQGQASAKSMAAALGISLRGAQEALSELSSAGACDAQREGRNITYVVEDTAFSEPTTRLHARQLEESPEGVRRSKVDG